MRPSEVVKIYRGHIHRIVRLHHASNPRVFGCVLLGEDGEESDLEILIDPTAKTTLFSIFAIRHELRKLLGLRVHVLTPRTLPARFPASVLTEARPI
nr:nucleotidyltransferase [Rhodoferax sp. OV413]